MGSDFFFLSRVLWCEAHQRAFRTFTASVWRIAL